MSRELSSSPVQQDDLNVHLQTIAHELKHPIIAIQGYTSLLSEKYSQTLPEEGQEFLDRITLNIKRAESLLSDISKLACASVNEEAFEEIPSQRLIDAAIDALGMQIHEQNVKVEIQESLPRLYCDKEAMILVLINLIGNAIKYSRLRTTSRVSIGCFDDELFYKFYIKDNGIGFRAKDRSRIFVLFSRLRHKRNVSGTGVGLAIVKKIVLGHGGEIWVESRMNQGSTFYFTLPKNVNGTS